MPTRAYFTEKQQSDFLQADVQLPTTVTKSKTTKDVVFGVARSYFDESEMSALDLLIQRESTWRTNADNPKSTAYGLFQFLDGTWDDVGCVKTPDIKTQADCGMKYIVQRYGTPTKALEFHIRNGHY